MRFLISFLFLTIQAWSCDVPQNVIFVGSSDICASVQSLRTAFSEARKRWWLISYVQAPFGAAPIFPDIRLENMGLLILEEFPGPALPTGALGAFFPFGPEIQYATGSPLRDVAFGHEVAHWFGWKNAAIYGALAYFDMGHGTCRDPQVETVNKLIRVFWEGIPETHSYWPGILPLRGCAVALRETL